MAYHYSRKLDLPFDEALSKVTQNLQEQGFSVITCIDVHDALKQRLNIDFRKYKILGAFNSEFAYKIITLESHLGLIIPCHLVVQQHENGDVEVSAISPLEATEGSLSTPLLIELATQIDNHLRRAVDDLHRQTGEHQHPEALPIEASQQRTFAIQP